MTIYLDTSVVVAMFVDDPHVDRAKRITSTQDLLILSDLAAAEFCSALAIQVRNGRTSVKDVRAAFGLFDTWCDLVPRRIEVLSADLRAAQTVIRQLDHPLKTPDATHIMIARRIDATLATFDETMAREAARLGVPLAQPI